MKNVCRECKHFRRLKPASQLLALAFSTTDATVSNALVKIQEDENQQKGPEAQFRMKKDNIGDEVWDFRPVMSDFCGLKEEEETYLISEVKNRGGQCNDFKQGRPDTHSCSACVYRILPEGIAKDIEMEETLSGLSADSVATNSSATTPDNILSKYREGAASRKAFEASGVYSAKGTLSTKPNYLDYCSKFSMDDEFVICLLRNPYHTCMQWEENTNSNPQKTEDAASLAKKSSSSSTPVFKLPKKQLEDVVVSPELKDIFENYCSFWEWTLDVKLTVEARRLLHSELVNIWSTQNRIGMENVEKNISFLDQVRKENKATQDYNRELMQQQFVPGLRQNEGDPGVRALLELYNAANVPLVPGNPPLTQKTAECAIELLNLIRTAGHSQPIPEETRKDFLRKLINKYSEMSGIEQWEIGRSPLLWTAVRSVGIQRFELCLIGRGNSSYSAAFQNAGMPGFEVLFDWYDKLQTLDRWMNSGDKSYFAPNNLENIRGSGDIYSNTQSSEKRIYENVPQESEIDRLNREIKEAQAKGDSQKVAELRMKLQIKLQEHASNMAYYKSMQDLNHQTMMHLSKW